VCAYIKREAVVEIITDRRLFSILNDRVSYHIEKRNIQVKKNAS